MGNPFTERDYEQKETGSREEGQYLQMFYEHALDAAVLCNEQSIIIDVNKATTKLLDQSREKIVGRSIHDYMPLVPKDLLEHQRLLLELNGTHRDELIISLCNGHIKHIQYVAIKEEKGGNDLFIIRDVSSHKALERERTISNYMFADVFTRAVDGMLLFDEKGIIQDANPSFCRSIYTDHAAIIGTKLLDWIIPSYGYKIDKLWKVLKQRGSAQGELPIRHDKGVSVFEFTTSSNIHNGLYLSIMRDVTEKRNMERLILKNEQLFTDLFEKALDGIVLWDADLNIVRANEAACRIFECEYDELLTKKWGDFVYKKDVRYTDMLENLREDGGVREELLFLMPNGQKKLLEFTAKMHSMDGYNMTIFRNVSEQREMERNLRESEQKFRKIFEGALDGMFLWNDRFEVIDCNQLGYNWLEHENKDDPIRTVTDLLGKEGVQRHEIALHLRNLYENGHDHGTSPLILESGREKHFEFSSKLNIIPGINLTVFRDITDKLEMEERLRKSDTLNVVGELAAGIAHEIRNPMTALKGFIQLLESSVKEDHSMYFNVITSELQRIESIITEFLILAKPQAVHYLEKDVTQILRETVDLLNAQAMMTNVQFLTYYEENLPNLYCEPNQLKQVFINIIKNAIEVMPKGGFITISLRKLQNKQLQVTIEDEGSGIPEEKIRRLGEPFYTTKERGTGLGLMVSYKIVEEHHGTVEVESEVGKGTVFHINLPLQTVELRKK